MTIRQAVVWALAMLAGCSSSSSSDSGPNGGPVPTGEMYLNASVVAVQDTTAGVRVTLDDGRLLLQTEYALRGGDALQACVSGQCVGLRHDFSLLDIFSPGGYQGELPYVPNAEYVVSFSRPAAGNAPRSSTTLAPAFEISSPADGEQRTAGDTIDLVWSPADPAGPARIEAEVWCRHQDRIDETFPAGVYSDSAGDGIEQLAVDELFANLDFFAKTTSPLEKCEITLEVAYRRDGTVDPAFAGGFIVARTSRSVKLEYLPPP